MDNRTLTNSLHSPKIMLEEIAQAIELGDYKTAIRLLKPLIQSDPEHPKVQYYAGRIYEAQGKFERAQALYRKLLAANTHPQFLSQVRQSLKRLETLEGERRERSIARALTQSGGQEPGVLILEPIASELKQQAAQEFAKIVRLDPYVARLQLPSRGWRLYRTGALGELRYLTSELHKARIPCFSESLAAVAQLEVLEVRYFTSLSGEIVARCQHPEGQIGSISFTPSEVLQGVEGRLPLFESVVTVDAKHQLQRKTQTQDYVRCCDLHLLKRNCILRMSDRTYQFQQGFPLVAEVEHYRGGTTTQNWQLLTGAIRDRLPQTVFYSDFTPFAETALGFRETLNRINSHIHLKRRKETPWDGAFQLYSTLAFLRARSRA